MGRQVRMVPENWVHPKRDGRYVPLLIGPFEDCLKEWEEGREKWKEGFREDFSEGGWKPLTDEEKELTFEDWDGEKPVAEDYMPMFKDGEVTHLMMYENTSEGTPISPAFPTPEELATWLFENNASAFAGNTASYDSWLATCKSGYAPTAMFSQKTGIISGVEANGRES